ncbi:MAG: phage replisome organizer N-terminal domain-containing protein [Clostridia bacterium]|nr:phage replisome organizer N-terminal domain-containing protein [Clostridia bacterium]
MAKQYYWLQLKEDFFRQKEIKLLRKIAGGDTYTIIYLKMMLMSLKDEGKILYEGVGSNLAEEIALEIDEDVENVQITINYLMSKNLLVTSSEYEGFLSDVPNLIGSESDSARRVRKHRQIKKAEEKKLQCNAETLQRNTEVTNGNTEIDIEIEKEIDIEQEPEKEVKPSGDDVYLFYQKNFKTESEFIKQDLENWVNVLSVEVVTLELQKAIKKNAQYSYAEGIMKSWANKGIKTLEAAEAESVGNQRQKQWRQQPKKEKMPEWAETDAPSSETAPDPQQQRLIAERIARLKTSQKREA